MIKLDIKHPISKSPSASLPDPKPVRRLIVLVPSFEINLPALAKKVWEMANASGYQVLFLGLYNEATQESRLRRDLVTMSAMVRDSQIIANVEVQSEKDWVQAVRSRFHEGDLVICLAEQRIGSSRRSLSQMLQVELNVPLYILSGLSIQQKPHTNWFSQSAAWMGSIAIIYGFFVLQIYLNRLSGDWAYTTLLFISIPVEVGLIWIWNSLFG